MAKFQLKYRLLVEAFDGQVITIEPPFTLSFTVHRGIGATLNDASFTIIGLNEDTRTKIFQDRFDAENRRRIIFQAGYEDLTTLFVGNIHYATSYKEGRTEIATYIHARDGGYDASNAFTSRSLEGVNSLKGLLKAMLGDFTQVNEGVLAGQDEEISRPVVLNGNTFTLIQEYSNGKAFIDNQKLFVLDDDEAIEGLVPVINSDAGLLETPRRENAYLEIKTMFNPKITVGQVLEVQSSVNKVFDGQYKVIGMNHSGTISEAVASRCTSTFDLLVGSQLFGRFKIV